MPLTIFITIFLLLGSMSPTVSAQHQVDSPTPLKLQLVWKHQFQFAGYYMAKEKGYYRDRNLDVEILELDPGTDNVESVLQGQADFAVGRSSLLIDKARGADIVALFTAFQKSPFMLLTKAFTGIQKPEDLRGRRIMITQDAERSGELIAMLAQHGLKQRDYIQQTHSFDVTDLINNRTDAMASYISNEPYKMLQQGIPYHILHPADHGFEMYSDILFTSGKMVRENPQLTQDFYEASIEGWKYAFANITETVSTVHQKYNTQKRSKEALLYEAQELKRLAFDERKNFGTLLPHRFQAMAHIYLLTGAIDKNPDLDGFIYNPPSDQLNLTYEEIEYIKQQQAINICVQKDWPPYEHMAGKKYQGIIADFIHLLRDKIGLSVYEIPTDSSKQAITLTLQGICDMSSVFDTGSENNNRLLSTHSFINIPLVYVSNQAITDLDDFQGKLGIANQAPYSELLIDTHKGMQTVVLKDVLDGLERLQQGNVDVVIGTQAHIRYLMSQHEFDDLVIHKERVVNWKPGFAINHQRLVLHSLINKSIEIVSQQERDSIMSRWIYSKPKQGMDARTYWLIIAIISVFALLILYRYFTAVLRSRILKDLSETDQLTGINNRRKTIHCIQQFIDLSNRYHQALSLIYFDIDNFKQVNDRFGHAAGDRILKELATLISSEIRKTDVFGRWGGEEFILASPNTGIEHAEKLATLLMHSINNYDFKLEQDITCSFGVTQYLANESLDDFLSRADESMYKAKQKGKNRVDITEIDITESDTPLHGGAT